MIGEIAALLVGLLLQTKTPIYPGGIDPVTITPTVTPTPAAVCPDLTGVDINDLDPAYVNRCRMCIPDQPTPTSVLPTVVIPTAESFCKWTATPDPIGGGLVVTDPMGTPIPRDDFYVCEGTPTVTPTPTITPTASAQAPHWYAVIKRWQEYIIPVESGSLVADVYVSPPFSAPELACGGDDIDYAYAQTVDYMFTGVKDNAYIQLKGLFLADLWYINEIAQRAGTGQTVDGTTRMCAYRWDSNNIYYCDKLQEMTGWINDKVINNVAANGGKPANSWQDRWVRAAGTNNHYDFTVLCYGDEEPMEIAPTPTPDAGMMGCNQVQYRDTRPAVDIIGLGDLEIITGECHTIIPDLSGISSFIIPGMIADILDVDAQWYGVQVCEKRVTLPTFKLLNFTIPLDIILLPMLVFLLIAVLRL